MLLEKREVIEELIRQGLKGIRLRLAYRNYDSWARAHVCFTSEGGVIMGNMQWQDISGNNDYWVLGDPAKPQAYIFRQGSDSWSWAAGNKSGQTASRSAAQAAAERALKKSPTPSSKKERVNPDDLFLKKGESLFNSGIGRRISPY